MIDIPEFRRLLGARLAKVAQLFPTKSAASDAAGVTAEQYGRWVKGEAKVPVEALARLADAADVDLRWLCAGEQKSSLSTKNPGRVIDEAVLRLVLAALSEALTKEAACVTPAKLPDLALALHDYVLAQKPTAADLSGVADLMLLAAR